MGGLRTGTKSELLPCIENLVSLKENLSTCTPRVQVNILDGAGIIIMLRPGTAKTFQSYATGVFVSYITSHLEHVFVLYITSHLEHVFVFYVTSHLEHVEKLYIVWDLYVADSLKTDTRSKRGKGVRRRVEPSSAIPGN